MKKKGKLFLLLLIIHFIAAGTVFAGGTQEAEPQESAGAVASGRALPADALPAAQQVFYAPLKDDTTTYMDIMKSQYNCIHFATESVQLSLVAFDNNFNTVPVGAESWEVAEDGLTWTFKLRQGMKYSDGTPITAGDWVYTLRRTVSQGYDFSWIWRSGAGIKNWSAVEKGELPVEELGISAPDDNTLVITTAVAKPYLPQVLVWFYLVPRHIVEKYGDEYATKADTMVASGPYMIEEWVQGDRISLVPNPYYNGPWKPYLSKLVFLYGVSDPVTAFPAYMNDEIYLTNLNMGQLALVRQNSPEELQSWPSPRVFYLAFDPNVAPFDDIRVRQALQFVIDRDEITSTVLKDISIPEYQILAKGFVGYDKDAASLSPHDADRARKLLAEAGYPGGKGFPKLELWIGNIASVAPWQEPAGEYLQAYFKKELGIEIVPRFLEKKTFIDAMKTRKHNFFMTSYKYDYIDPSTYLDVFLTGGRHAWSSAEYDKLVKAADAGGPWEKRLQNYQEAQRIMIQDASFVFMFQAQVHAAWKSNVKGEAVSPNEVGITSFETGLVPFNYTHIYLSK